MQFLLGLYFFHNHVSLYNLTESVIQIFFSTNGLSNRTEILKNITLLLYEYLFKFSKKKIHQQIDETK